jgi:hypothetical protein
MDSDWDYLYLYIYFLTLCINCRWLFIILYFDIGIEVFNVFIIIIFVIKIIYHLGIIDEDMVIIFLYYESLTFLVFL